MSKLDTPIEISKKTTVFGIITILTIGLIVRLIYFPYDLPLSLDALSYFAYGFELSETGNFPINFILVNNGWSIFLSLFFSLFGFDNFIGYMNVERMVSVVISVSTSIPLYFLCRKFFTRFLSLIGAGLFLLEPRIISNSLLGITEPIYIILGATAIILFLSHKKWIYLSFAVLAIFSLIRYEGLLLLIPFSIMFFIKFKNEHNQIIKFLLCIGICLLILFPMSMIRIDTMGHDGFISHYLAGIIVINEYVIQGNPDEDDEFPGEEGTNRLIPFIITGLSTLVINFGIIQIPVFVFFLPLGIMFIMQNRAWRNFDHRHGLLLLCFIFCLIPILYAHGRLILEFRYYFILYPIIILICIYGLNKLQPRFINKKIILIPLILGVLILSLFYLEFNKMDLDLEREAFEITSKAATISYAINGDSLHGDYITTANMVSEWPDLKKPSDVKINKISPSGFNDISEFIIKSKEKGLDHIVVDNLGNGPDYIQYIFDNEREFPYLEKVFDSKENGYEYHVKIFRINYDYLDNRM